jgi:hypothetical protein
MYRTGPRLFWPIILIGVGVIFLLNNLGVITGSPWEVIWRLWPVLLIALGLEILIGRTGAVGSLISAVLGLGVVVGVLWILITRPALPGFNLNFSGELKTTPVEYPLKDVRSASVSIGFTTGTNELRALTDSTNLLEGTIRHYGNLTFDASDSGSQASVRMKSSNVSIAMPFGGSEEHWTVALNPAVAYDLTLEMGVGQSTVDLSKLTVTGGRLNAGVGVTDLTLPAKGKFTLSIDGGVGLVKIRLPGKMALRAEVDTGLGSFNPGSRLRALGGDVYETEGFDLADNAITLRIKAGVGTLRVIDGE